MDTSFIPLSDLCGFLQASYVIFISLKLWREDQRGVVNDRRTVYPSEPEMKIEFVEQ